MSGMMSPDVLLRPTTMTFLSLKGWGLYGGLGVSLVSYTVTLLACDWTLCPLQIGTF